MFRLAMRRLRSEWRLMSSVFMGIVIATVLMSAAPAYLDALERQSVNSAVRTLVERAGDTFFDIVVDFDFIPLESDEIESAQAAQTQVVTDNMGPIYEGTRSHLRTPYYSMTLPVRASATLAAQEAPLEEGEEPPLPFETGFVHYLEGVEEKVTFLEGGPASDVVLRGPQGPLVEAVLSARTANAFGGLKPGDVLVFAPSVDSPIKVSARITGLVEATYWSDPYWRDDFESFLFPQMPTEDGAITPDSPPLLGIFVGPTSLTGGIGGSFPGATVDAVWYNDVDPEILRTWSKGEMRSRLDALDDEMSVALPTSSVFGGIGIMLARFERESFLTSVPLLLLMTVLGIAVFYFLFMIVSYLIPNRESDVALFRSRGTSTWRLLRLYMAEGAILTVIRGGDSAIHRAAACMARRPAALLLAYNGRQAASRSRRVDTIRGGGAVRRDVSRRIRHSRGTWRKGRAIHSQTQVVAPATGSGTSALLYRRHVPGCGRRPVLGVAGTGRTGIGQPVRTAGCERGAADSAGAIPRDRGDAVLPHLPDVHPVHQWGVADAGGYGGVGDGGGTGSGYRGDGLSRGRADGVDPVGSHTWRFWGRRTG